MKAKINHCIQKTILCELRYNNIFFIENYSAVPVLFGTGEGVVEVILSKNLISKKKLSYFFGSHYISFPTKYFLGNVNKQKEDHQLFFGLSTYFPSDGSSRPAKSFIPPTLLLLDSFYLKKIIVIKITHIIIKQTHSFTSLKI